MGVLKEATLRTTPVLCLLLVLAASASASTYLVLPDGTGDFPTIQDAGVGGAIACDDSAHPLILSCLFPYNSAGYGGAFDARGASPRIMEGTTVTRRAVLVR